MTLEEKMEVIKAFSEGKAVEIYSEYSEKWLDKRFDVWDFEEQKYRIKPEETAKFKAGDVLLAKKGEHQANPTRFEVTNIKLGHYCFKYHLGAPIIDVDKNYINERDALWYFEIYDYGTKTWELIANRRFTIKEADEEFASCCDTTKWRPMYALGFALNEDK